MSSLKQNINYALDNPSIKDLGLRLDKIFTQEGLFVKGALKKSSISGKVYLQMYCDDRELKIEDNDVSSDCRWQSSCLQEGILKSTYHNKQHILDSVLWLTGSINLNFDIKPYIPQQQKTTTFKNLVEDITMAPNQQNSNQNGNQQIPVQKPASSTLTEGVEVVKLLVKLIEMGYLPNEKKDQIIVMALEKYLGFSELNGIKNQFMVEDTLKSTLEKLLTLQQQVVTQQGQPQQQITAAPAQKHELREDVIERRSQEIKQKMEDRRRNNPVRRTENFNLSTQDDQEEDIPELREFLNEN